ncbi:MAG: hypothetical protein QHH75_06950 [Bacillota bacterium]|nr:hypothetical protein [Bacillota bacterium]
MTGRKAGSKIGKRRPTGRSARSARLKLVGRYGPRGGSKAADPGPALGRERVLN